MKIAIIDDDKEFTNFLSGQIKEKANNIGLEVNVSDYHKSIDFIKELFEYELIFLDIEMPDINGIQLMDQINVSKRGSELPLVVFVTNKDSYVYTALSTYPFSFMRKSYVESEIEVCLSQANKRIKMLKSSVHTIKLKVNNVVLDVKDVIYVEKNRHNIIYKCVENEYAERENMAQKAVELESLGFIRIHEGFAVNAEHIKKLGYTKAVVSNGDELIVSRKYKDGAVRNYYEWLSRKARRSSW